MAGPLLGALSFASKVPKLVKAAEKISDPARTQVIPMPNRWFLEPDKFPNVQGLVERVLATNKMERSDFFSGAFVDPKTAKVLDFGVMNDVGVAIDPKTNRPKMSGMPSGLESFNAIPKESGPATHSNLVRKGLFKRSGGDPILDDLNFLATIERSGAGHQYGLSTEYATPTELLNTMTGQNPTLRPHSRGDLFGVGDVVGQIVTPQGLPKEVYESLLVAPKGSDVQGVKLHKAEGGVVRMKDGTDEAIRQILEQAKNSSTATYDRLPTGTMSQFEQEFRDRLARDQTARQNAVKRGVSSWIPEIPGMLADLAVDVPYNLAQRAAGKRGENIKLLGFGEDVRRGVSQALGMAPASLGEAGMSMSPDETNEAVTTGLQLANPLMWGAAGNPAAIARVAGKGAKALGPTAANLMEDYMMKAGLMPSVVKPKGGNWLPEGTKALEGLKPNRYAADDRKMFEAELADLMEQEARTPGRHAARIPVVQGSIAEMDRNIEFNNWIDKQLTRYVKNEMGTPEDPVRAMADAWPAQREAQIAQKAEKIKRLEDKLQSADPRLVPYIQRDIDAVRDEIQAVRDYNPLHYSIEGRPPGVPSTAFGGRLKAGYPKFGMAESELAKDWENTSDAAIRSSPYRMSLPMVTPETAPDALRALGGEFAVQNPNAMAYSINGDSRSDVIRGQESIRSLGFDHLIDELRNATNPASGLPRELLLKPESLSKLSVPQAVERVAKINEWRAEQISKARLDNMLNAEVHKEYPEQGMRWVRLNKKGQFAEESDAMGHSVRGYEPTENGGSSGYGLGGWDAIQSGKAKVYSLRDAKGQPHATIEVKSNGTLVDEDFGANDLNIVEGRGEFGERGYKTTDDKFFESYADAVDHEKKIATPNLEEIPSITQIKGKSNSAPNEKYLPYVQDFVRSQQWSDVKDLRNTGMRDLSKMSGMNDWLKTNRPDVGRFVPEEEYIKLENEFLGPQSDKLLGDLGMKRGGPVSQDAMQMAVWSKAVRKAGGGEVTQAEIDAATQPYRMPVPKRPKLSIDTSGAKAAGTVLSAMAAGIPAGYAGMLELARTGFDPKMAADAAEALQERYMSIPDDQRTAEKVGGIANLLKPLSVPAEYIGEKVLGLTGSPLSATAAEVFLDPLNYLPAIGKAPAAAKAVGRVASEIANAELTGRSGLSGQRGAITWHGSPHRFPPTAKNPLGEFDPMKIGTGEGAQAYGVGAGYLAEAKDVGAGYRRQLSGTVQRPDVEYKGKDYLGGHFSGIEGQAVSTIADALAKDMPITEAIKQAGKIAKARFARDVKQVKSVGMGVDEFLQSPEEYKALLRQIKAIDPANLKRIGDPRDPGHLYKVDLPDEQIAKMLDWDKPLSQQDPHVQLAIIDIANSAEDGSPIIKAAQSDASGEKLYRALQGEPEMNENRVWVDNRKKASQTLDEFEIPGIRYLDQGSRPNTNSIARIQANLDKAIARLKNWQGNTSSLGESQRKMFSEQVDSFKKILQDAQNNPATSNFVVFDPKHMNIVGREKEGGLVNQDAMQMAVWDKAVRKGLGGAVGKTAEMAAKLAKKGATAADISGELKSAAAARTAAGIADLPPEAKTGVMAGLQKPTAALSGADKAEARMVTLKDFKALGRDDKVRAIASARAAADKTGVARTTQGLSKAFPEESDMVSSFMASAPYKIRNVVPDEVVDAANAARKSFRSEPATTPGAKASEKEWAAWGKSHGVNMTLTKPQSLGISDLTSGREVMIPGGLSGKFTIPDMFWMKSNNINPASLPQDVHTELMKKFIRTHENKNPDAVDIFNQLDFALLSPSAPLVPNEFLTQRLRIKDMDELRALAGRVGESGLDQSLVNESGVGAALGGGLGIRGTANLKNQAVLADLILKKPEMFQAGPGETLRDVTIRVMNQVPGLGTKTASLGTPWLDLSKANTSAVDLHMIRDATPRLLQDPVVGDAFRSRMANLLGTEPTVEAILAMDPRMVQEAAIKIVGASQSKNYRLASGDLNDIPAMATPDKLLNEPSSFTDFGPFYNRVVDYVDQSRGLNPEIALFPEQWRKWDVIRQRIEPHEFAHPDWRKLPKQSFNEMQDSLKEHSRVGYKQSINPTMKTSDWRKLYYGKVDPELLIPLAGGAAAASAYLADEAQKQKKGDKVVKKAEGGLTSDDLILEERKF